MPADRSPLAAAAEALLNGAEEGATGFQTTNMETGKTRHFTTFEVDGDLLAALRAAVAADRIEELEAVVRREGSTYTTKDGVVCPSPLLAEIRLQDAVLTRNLRGIVMEAKNENGKDAAKSRAGMASWRARQSRNITSVGVGL